MKTKSSIICAAVVALAGIVSGHAGPQLDPATCLPGHSPGANVSNPGQIDPTTGLPARKPGALMLPEEMVNLAVSTSTEVRALTLNGQYEDALKRCLAYHNRAHANTSLSFLIFDWVELGRRYPKAKAALLAIRDRDVREFSEGRGYFDLFQEIASINQRYGNTEATYALFKTIREKDPELARQCIFCVESEVAEREGTPQDRYAIIQRHFEQMRSVREHQAEIRERSAQMMPEQGITNSPVRNSFAERSRKIAEEGEARQKQMAENNFVKQTCQLIQTLVASGHTADAEKIRDQAVAMLDDARLKSAVTDAKEAVEKHP